jgi:hypothetical protein
MSKVTFWTASTSPPLTLYATARFSMSRTGIVLRPRWVGSAIIFPIISHHSLLFGFLQLKYIVVELVQFRFALKKIIFDTA